jgi:hypothetical protein
MPNCLGPGENSDDYTVEGLFATVRYEMQQPARSIRTLIYDSVYGFPERFESDAEGWTDSDYVQDVKDFAVLP